MRVRLVGAMVAMVVSAASPAFAQVPDPAPPAEQPAPTAEAKANAQRLFDQAKTLHDAGSFKEACPLFAESQRLDAGLGTLLYLSDCYDQVGATASAWAGFREAAALAKAKNQPERERIARERAAALEPKLPMLKLEVAEDNRDIGIVIKRNGVEMGAVTWGKSLPVDPGEQKIEATAPGYKPWSTTVLIEPGPSKAETSVPALERAPDAPVTPGQSDDQTGLVMRIAGLALGGVGVVGIALGTGFGVDALITYGDARDTCENDDPTRCTPEGERLQRDASDSALVSTVAFSVGAVALVGGALVFFLAPSDDDEPVAAPGKAKASPGFVPKIGVSFDDRGAFFTLGGTL
jgi:serine/threonine-protein kinase